MSDEYKALFPHVELRKKENSRVDFRTTAGGYRLSTSCPEGSVTGRGADYLICDDAHEAQRVQSDIERENACKWFDGSFYNRLNPFSTSAARLVIGQRVHRFDLSGHILRKYKSWTHLVIPWEYQASKDPKAPLGYAPLGLFDPREREGEEMFPGLVDQGDLADVRQETGRYLTQYQQAPTNSETSYFKADNFRYYQDTDTAYILGEKVYPKRECFRMTACDPSLSAKSDYTAIVTADFTQDGNVVIVDVFRERLYGGDVVPALASLYNAYRPVYVIIESNLFQALFYSAGRDAGIPIRSVYAQGSKEIRSLLLRTRCDNGQLWFAKDKAWVGAVEKELLEFPSQYCNDDAVDAMMHLCTEAAKRIRARPIEEKKEPTAEELAEERRRRFNAYMLQGTE
jgi:predicted phage terminase large subunit-like protein